MKKIYSRTVIALLFLLAPVAAVAADDKEINLSGDWAGEINAIVEQLEVLIRIEQQADGNLSATVSVPKKSELPMPANRITRDDRDLRIEVESIGGSFEGKLNGKGDRIRGDWTQGDYTTSLDLERIEGGFAQQRPQMPKPPFSYQIEQVSFANPFAKIQLAGTLTLPKEKTRSEHPAVILVSDNGPQDRDATDFDHRPFAVIADYLTRQGIAVLRYDDRGTGKSTGEHAFGHTRDFATDAWSAVDFLSRHSDIDGNKLGIIGHGEGALIATMVAEKRRDIAFIVMLAAPALRGDATLLAQTEALGIACGVGDHTRGLLAEFSAALYDLLIGDPVAAAAEAQRLGAELQKSVAALPAQDADKLGEVGIALDSQIKSLETPWFGRYVAHDPGPGIAALTCPVLALYGETDLEIPAGIHLPAMERHLKKAGHADSEVRQLRRLNHRFQETENGRPTLYGTFDETFSPDALRALSAWLKDRCQT